MALQPEPPSDLVVDGRQGRRHEIARYHDDSGRCIEELLRDQVAPPSDLPMEGRLLRRPGSGKDAMRDTGCYTEGLLGHQVEPPGDLSTLGRLARRPGSAKDLLRDSGYLTEELLGCQVAPPSSTPALPQYRWLWPVANSVHSAGPEYVEAMRRSSSLCGPGRVFGCPSTHRSSHGGGAEDMMWRWVISREGRRASQPGHQLPHNRSDGFRATAFVGSQRRPVFMGKGRGNALACSNEQVKVSASRAGLGAHAALSAVVKPRLGCSCTGGRRRPFSPRRCSTGQACPPSSWRLTRATGASPFR